MAQVPLPPVRPGAGPQPVPARSTVGSPPTITPGGQVSPTVDETTGEDWKPSFWQLPFVQTAMPFISSLVFHVGLIILGLILITQVPKAFKPLHHEINIDSEAPLAEDGQVGGVPHPGIGGAEADAAQDKFQDVPPDSQGISDKKSDSTAMSLAGGGNGDDNDGLIAVGPKSGGYGVGHSSGTAAGEGTGIGNGDDGATAPFGVPNTGKDGLLPKAAFCGFGGNARKIVFVCDATGSMMDKFDALRNEIQKAVTNLKPSQCYSVIFFQEKNDTHPDDMVAFSKDLVVALPENKKKSIDFVANVTPRGGTNPVPGLKAGMAMHPDLMFFLVDPGDFPDKPGVLALLRQLNADHKTKIFTIAFFDHDPDDEKFLKQVADENGGHYKMVDEKSLEN